MSIYGFTKGLPGWKPMPKDVTSGHPQQISFKIAATLQRTGKTFQDDSEIAASYPQSRDFCPGMIAPTSRGCNLPCCPGSVWG